MSFTNFFRGFYSQWLAVSKLGWWVISYFQLVLSPGGNTPRGTKCTATCLPSRKLSKLGEQDMQDIAEEAETTSWVMYSYGPPRMAEQKQDNQLEHTFSSYVRIQDVVLKTSRRRCLIGRSGERGSGISVLSAQHDDDDDDCSVDSCVLTIFD